MNTTNTNGSQVKDLTILDESFKRPDMNGLIHFNEFRFVYSIEVKDIFKSVVYGALEEKKETYFSPEKPYTLYHYEKPHSKKLRDHDILSLLFKEYSSGQEILANANFFLKEFFQEKFNSDRDVYINLGCVLSKSEDQIPFMYIPRRGKIILDAKSLGYCRENTIGVL